jgi:hypothetical protein
MPQTLFAIAASPELAARTANVVSLDLSGPPDALRPLVLELAGLYLESTVDGLVLVFIRSDTSAFTTSLLRNLATVVKTAARAVIGQAFGSTTSDELRALAKFLGERVQTVTLDGKPQGAIVFPLAEPFVSKARKAVAAAHAGRALEERALFIDVMSQVVVENVRVHYETPFSLVKLGFLKKKAIDVGKTAIATGGQTTVKKSLGVADNAELQGIARFLERSVVDV